MTAIIYTGATADELWPLVRDHHYSRRMPGVVQHCFAAREVGGLFGDTGVPLAGVIFGKSANNQWPQDAVELQRLVRVDSLKTQLSQLVAFSLRFLRANYEIPFAFSYADTGEGHHGGIYQATGWHYINLSKGDRAFVDDNGKYVHGRNAYRLFGTRSETAVLERNPGWSLKRDTDKHVYIFPLRQKWPSIARQRGWQSLPYPKPNAACPLDAGVPAPVSAVQPREAAPILQVEP